MYAPDFRISDWARDSETADYYFPAISVTHRQFPRPVAGPDENACHSGRIISHYKFLDKIGQGGMGSVYKAYDLNLQRPVAIKVLPAHRCADEDIKFQFISEARLLSASEHPYICTVHSIFEDAEGALYMVMTYYQGKSLRQYIHPPSISLYKKIAVIKQIASGLLHAHQKGIIHQDVKPDNVIITNEEIVKIIDFGVASLIGDRKASGISGGTVAYMSPEQVNRTDIDHRTDIWSLGVIFYELLSGVLPFHKNYEQAVLFAIMKEKPPPLSNIPKQLSAIVFKCLEKDPDQRYQSMWKLLTDLELFYTRGKRLASKMHFELMENIYFSGRENG